MGAAFLREHCIIKVLIKLFQKFAMSPKVLQSKALGEEPLVALRRERNPLSVQELAGLGDCDRGAHSKIASAQRIHLLAVSPMDLEWGLRPQAPAKGTLSLWNPVIARMIGNTCISFCCFKWDIP